MAIITIDSDIALKYINDFISQHDKELYDAGFTKTLENNTISLFLWESSLKQAEINGEWLSDNYMLRDKGFKYKCNNCGYGSMEDYEYCPQCGANMK